MSTARKDTVGFIGMGMMGGGMAANLLQKGFAVVGHDVNPARNKLLAEMTEEVADLCLADNDRQTLAITLDAMRSKAALDEHLDCIDALVAAQFLSPVDDSVPSREALKKDAVGTATGLTPPATVDPATYLATNPAVDPATDPVAGVAVEPASATPAAAQHLDRQHEHREL